MGYTDTQFSAWLNEMYISGKLDLESYLRISSHIQKKMHLIRKLTAKATLRDNG